MACILLFGASDLDQVQSGILAQAVSWCWIFDLEAEGFAADQF
jgi:hypothetical protein